MVAKIVAVAAFHNEPAECQPVTAGIGQHPLSVAVEELDLCQHPQVSGPCQGAQPRGDADHAAGAGVLETAALTPHPEGHVRVLDAHVQLGEQAQQGRVGAQIHDDESGVESQFAAVGGAHRHRVGVSADSVVLLEHRHLVVTRDHIRSRQAGDATSDHGDSQLLCGTHTSIRQPRSAGSSKARAI